MLLKRDFEFSAFGVVAGVLNFGFPNETGETFRDIAQAVGYVFGPALDKQFD